MRWLSASAIIGAAAATELRAAPRLKVEVYGGPSKCDDVDKVSKGNFLSVRVNGTIDESSQTGEKGKVLYSSLSPQMAFNFQIGTGEVIKGWDEGMLGLCKGSKATLVVPPDMAYGDDGAGDQVPGGATLKYEVEVMDVQKPPSLFEQYDYNRDGYLDRQEIGRYYHEFSIPRRYWKEDTNRDGYISWEEFSGIEAEEPDTLFGSISASISTALGKIFDFSTSSSDKAPPKPNEFEKLDVNNDGGISQEEMMNYFHRLGKRVPYGLFEREDKNRDESISWEEFSGPKGDKPPASGRKLRSTASSNEASSNEGVPNETAQKSVPVPTPRKPNEFARIDKNGDGKLDRREVKKHLARQSKAEQKIFWKVHDTNRNGEISWQEFKGPKGTTPPRTRNAREPAGRRKRQLYDEL